jgi:hypothetical protein
MARNDCGNPTHPNHSPQGCANQVDAESEWRDGVERFIRVGDHLAVEEVRARIKPFKRA